MVLMKTILISTVVLTLIILEFVSGQTVRLAWDLNEDPSVTSYVVRYGRESGVHPESVDVGNQNLATVIGLTVGVVYYFVVHAVNSAGLESLPSNEVFTVARPEGQQVTWYRVQATMKGEFELQQSKDLVTWDTIVTAQGRVDAMLPVTGNAAFFRLFPWDGKATVEGTVQ